jgi:hypothetical protein
MQIKVIQVGGLRKSFSRSSLESHKVGQGCAEEKQTRQLGLTGEFFAIFIDCLMFMKLEENLLSDR